MYVSEQTLIDLSSLLNVPDVPLGSYMHARSLPSGCFFLLQYCSQLTDLQKELKDLPHQLAHNHPEDSRCACWGNNHHAAPEGLPLIQ